jgi:hypothetical protein
MTTRLCLAAWLLTAAPSAPADETRGGPVLERLELITRGAATGDGGNDWGGHQARIVRAGDGLYVVYTTPGRSDNERGWALARRGDRGWDVVARGGAGREPVNLLGGPDGRLHVIGWPGGLPRIWSFTPEPGRLAAESREIPGDWLKSSHPYNSSAIGPQGDIYTLQSSGERPGSLRWARLASEDGRWRFTLTPTDYRHCYTYLVPGPGGALAIVATRDVPWSVLGYRQPPSGVRYVFNEIRCWETSDAARAPLRVTFARDEEPTGRFPDVFCDAQPDAYRDSRGRLHVLYWLRGPSTAGYEELRHAVVQGGALAADVTVAAGSGIYCRITEDGAGRLFLIRSDEKRSTIMAYPATSEDGTRLGPPTVLDLRGPRIVYSGLSIAAPRMGVPVGDLVDGAFPSAEKGTYYYVRLRLR